MKHKPNITIIDITNLVAAYGNNRKKEMFSPHNGMVVDPTPENIKRAKAGELQISLDWLNNFQSTRTQECDAHPITGSNDHFSLFDRFHKSNPKKRS
jgi:hypothetical protein